VIKLDSFADIYSDVNMSELFRARGDQRFYWWQSLNLVSRGLYYKEKTKQN